VPVGQSRQFLHQCQTSLFLLRRYSIFLFLFSLRAIGPVSLNATNRRHSSTNTRCCAHAFWMCQVYNHHLRLRIRAKMRGKSAIWLLPRTRLALAQLLFKAHAPQSTGHTGVHRAPDAYALGRAARGRGLDSRDQARRFPNARPHPWGGHSRLQPWRP
jgi:hypothetical protein